VFILQVFIAKIKLAKPSHKYTLCRRTSS